MTDFPFQIVATGDTEKDRRMASILQSVLEKRYREEPALLAEIDAKIQEALIAEFKKHGI